VLGFCQQRGISTDRIRIVQRVYSNPFTHMVDKIDLEIQVPNVFPDTYRNSLIRSAELCAVKKHLENPPTFEITTTKVEVAETHKGERHGKSTRRTNYQAGPTSL
jgi:ribosomal protein S12 methylthiotransferase accessory factor